MAIDDFREGIFREFNQPPLGMAKPPARKGGPMDDFTKMFGPQQQTVPAPSEALKPILQYDRDALDGAIQGPKPPRGYQTDNEPIRPEGIVQGPLPPAGYRPPSPEPMVPDAFIDVNKPSPAPQVDPLMQSFTTPGGGTVSMPPIIPGAGEGPTRGRTAQDIQDAIIGERRTGPQQYTDAEREQIRKEIQAGKVQQAKSGIGARIGVPKLAKSLRDRGMSEEDIEKAIGFEKGMSYEDAFRGLKALQKREDAKLSGTKYDQRNIKKISESATYDEDGNPTNDSGIAEGFINTFLGPEVDPESDKMLREYLTPSQDKEFERLITRAANNRLRKDDIGRMTRFKEQAMKKAQTKYNKKEAKESREAKEEAQRIARKNAQTSEDRKNISVLSKEYDAAQSDMDDISKFGINEENQAEYDAAKARRDRAVQMMATGQNVPTEVTDEQILKAVPDATPQEMQEIRAGLANGYTLEQMVGG